MARALLAVLDSFGIGGAPDADAFGDAGADTYGHIALACAHGTADRVGLRSGPLKLPNLENLGLNCVAEAARGAPLSGLAGKDLSGKRQPRGLHGHAREVSNGKDTPSGHWEIAGLPVRFDWGYFPRTVPAFPPELVAALVRQASLPGILGDKHASGTEIIVELGEEHIRTGKPICYTSADSVFQVAAHEAYFGLERLYRVCELARRLVDPLKIGRVIARPFVGESTANFTRTANRRDYAVPPPEPTVLDRLKQAGRQVLAVGKIGDIFAYRGVTRTVKGGGNDDLFDKMLRALKDARAGDLVFVNFIDFDSLYGHRRDVAGYAAALEAFDRRLPELEAALQPGDLAILTADHGCDPTWPGTDHTREQVPILGFGPNIAARNIGARASYADIGESIASHLGLMPGPHVRSFL